MKVVPSFESVVDIADLLLGCLNHLTNVIYYDNSCSKGLASHLLTRFNVVLDDIIGGRNFHILSHVLPRRMLVLS